MLCEAKARALSLIHQYHARRRRGETALIEKVTAADTDVHVIGCHVPIVVREEAPEPACSLHAHLIESEARQLVIRDAAGQRLGALAEQAR
jgi:hypothetical protein